MSVSVLIAVIGGVSAIVGAIISAYYARRLVRIQSNLEERRDIDKARRDYEYEARKRLYSVYEPIKFQLVDLIGQALRRISMLSIAPPMPGSTDEAACVYEVLAPVALVRMMDRNLTLTDMHLEPQVSLEYAFMKASYRVLADFGSIASIYSAVSGGALADTCGELLPYQLDDAADVLLGIASESSGAAAIAEKPVKLMTFSQFANFLSDSKDIHDRCGLGAIIKLLDGFTPGKRPVFWRCLVTQVLLYGCYLALVLRSPASQSDRLRDLGDSLLPEIEHALKAGIRLDKYWMSEEQPARPEIDADAVRDALACAAKYYHIRVLPAVDLAILASEHRQEILSSVSWRQNLGRLTAILQRHIPGASGTGHPAGGNARSPQTRRGEGK